MTTLQCCPAIHLTRDPADSAVGYRTPGVDLRLASLPLEHLADIGGVPVVTIARAVVDIARTRPFVDGVVAADAALRAGLDRRLLEAVLADCARWPGIRGARAVVAFADPLTESALESAGRVLMHRTGLPRPTLQHWLGRDGERRHRVDFWFPEHRTVGEADGLEKYRSAERDVAQEQQDRDAELSDLDLEIVHFGWADCFVRPPERLAARFRRAFARAERHRRTG